MKNVLGKIRKKIQETTAESLIETLAALLITCMGLSLLPGAIVAAARVNSKVEQAYEQGDPAETPVNLSIYITDRNGNGKQTILTNGESENYGATVYYRYQYQK